jgi:hypothetical protein
MKKDKEELIQSDGLGQSSETNGQQARIAVVYTPWAREFYNKYKNKAGTPVKIESKYTRRVYFDYEHGHIFLDGVRIYTASLNGPEYFFLDYLWQHWQKQLAYVHIRNNVRTKLGSDVADAAWVFCQKMKSKIKKECPLITKIVTVPTRGFYMMADPTEFRREEITQ